MYLYIFVYNIKYQNNSIYTYILNEWMHEGRKEEMNKWIRNQWKDPCKLTANKMNKPTSSIISYEHMNDYKILQRLHVHGGVRFHILQDHESKPFDTWDSLGVNISWPQDTAKVGMQRDSSWNLWTRSWQRSCGKCRPNIVKQNMLRHEVLIFVRPHPNSDGFLKRPDAIFVFQKLH